MMEQIIHLAPSSSPYAPKFGGGENNNMVCVQIVLVGGGTRENLSMTRFILPFYKKKMNWNKQLPRGWRTVHASSETHEAKQPRLFQKMLHHRTTKPTVRKAPSTLFHKHALTDTYNWRVSRWSTRKNSYAPPTQTAQQTLHHQYLNSLSPGSGVKL